MNKFELQYGIDKFELYTFLKGLQGLPHWKKAKILAELKRRVEVLS
jgi:hypothetical protein